jgi:uncharacterized coiled-coil protein SlyX
VQQRSQGAAAAEAPTLRQERTAARARLAELEAARAEREVALAELGAELARSRAEARRLEAELAAAWRWIEELNAVLVGLGVGPRATADKLGADPPVAARAVAAAAPAPAPAPAPTPGGAREDGARAAEGAGAVTSYVATAPVNLRAAPRNTAAVLTVVGRGERVRRLGRDGGWLRVVYTNRLASGYTGWVHGRFLRGAGG